MSAHESFEISDLLPSFLGRGRGFAVLMASYFDQSESGGFYTVGGYIFRKSQVRPFEKRWSRMLKRFDLPYFRMSACNAHQPPFSHLSKVECDLVAREAIATVIEYASYGYFVTVRQEEYDEILGRESFAGSTYALCCYVCLMGMRRWSDLNDRNALIAYFFEAGTENEGDADQLIKAIGGRRDEVTFDYRYAAHGFVQKELSMPTQAADMLAWHANKNYLRSKAGKKEPRGDFAALLDGVVTGRNNLTLDHLRMLDGIINKHTGGHPKGHDMVRWALRNDKRFYDDPEAILHLLAHARGG